MITGQIFRVKLRFKHQKMRLWVALVGMRGCQAKSDAVTAGRHQKRLSGERHAQNAAPTTQTWLRVTGAPAVRNIDGEARVAAEMMASARGKLSG
jgi:hypothetical protein